MWLSYFPRLKVITKYWVPELQYQCSGYVRVKRQATNTGLDYIDPEILVDVTESLQIVLYQVQI